ncbi:MAG: DUF4397 domain-containing protein [Sphingobacteriaceae bacterium]
MRFSSLLYTILFTTIVLISGCSKNEINYGEFTKVGSDVALLKVNFNISYYNNPAFHLKVNGARVSPLINTRYPFPGGGYNTLGDSRADYLSLSPGNIELSVVIPKKGTGVDSLEVYKTNLDLAAGKKYTLHLTDTAANIKRFLTEDDVAVPDSGFARYRFVNIMPNVPAVDLYYGASATNITADTLIAGNVAYLTSSPIITLKSGLARTWKVRPAGAAISNATVLAYYTSSSTFTNTRVYTIYASGFSGKTNAPQKPYVSFFLVK